MTECPGDTGTQIVWHGRRKLVSGGLKSSG